MFANASNDYADKIVTCLWLHCFVLLVDLINSLVKLLRFNIQPLNKGCVALESSKLLFPLMAISRMKLCLTYLNPCNTRPFVDLLL